jgi:two-component system, OmpR family, response regulator RegX3
VNPRLVEHEDEAAPTLHGAASPFPESASGHNSEIVQRRRKTVLLVEDEDSITVPLAEALGREGFDTNVAGNVSDALDVAKRVSPDLVLLDLMLPDGSGLDVCRELRRTSDVPIIILSARGEEADRVVGLELGADDYVVKPFSAREVVARIRAVLRRADAPAATAGGAVEIGEVRLDPDRREVTKAGELLELSRKEFELLYLLMRNAGSVVKREQLIDEVWDVSWFGSTKTLDVHVSGLRKKLGDDSADPRYLHTVRGVGFRFAAPEEAGAEVP